MAKVFPAKIKIFHKTRKFFQQQKNPKQKIYRAQKYNIGGQLLFHDLISLT